MDTERAFIPKGERRCCHHRQKREKAAAGFGKSLPQRLHFRILTTVIYKNFETIDRINILYRKENNKSASPMGFASNIFNIFLILS